MSFILDALKKSEIERQRQSVPGLMDTRVAQRRNRLPGWAIALGVLLGINLLVLTVVLTRKNAPTVPVAPAARPADTAAAPNTNTPPPVPQHFSPLDPAPVYAPEIPVAAPINPVALEPAPPRSAPHRVHRSDPLLTDPDAGAQVEELLPSINEISLTGSQALPELHLDVHVYATKPSERFVYINMRKYHEGATLQEGPALERIRRDGVVLNYQGLRFVLPRQP
ncbi:MAG: general secretion pathway protein GspB [Steroidobacteraceae bacterium]